ncbi:MAG: hypothetical protein Q4D13_02455 [Erysipelotrichaceae bacterium]|nr:hypothetical protein [Erysipelotrichaceae bacterium]
MRKKNSVVLTVLMVVLLVGAVGYFVYDRYTANKVTVTEETVEDTVEEEPVEEEPVVLRRPVTIKNQVSTPVNAYNLKVNIQVSSDYDMVYSPGNRKGYRYGPSIMKHDDGTIDMWMSRPGNNSTMWDYIAYRHYDGTEWSEEEIVLKPTPGSMDQCSCCDPGVIYFNGYYYLAYTGTANYEMGGMDNSAFVARSENPNGPYEKWNGSSWGGNPYPLVYFTEDQVNWGLGEVSFVSLNDELYVYHSYVSGAEVSVRLWKADMSENWPSTMSFYGAVSYRDTVDSYDIVYDENLKTFFAFTIKDRMSASSCLEVLASNNGRDFVRVAYIKGNIMNYSHNMGIMKDEYGHINSAETLMIGYAFGESWGAWPLILQDMDISLVN